MDIEKFRGNFWGYVKLDTEDRCWLWIGASSSHGYGNFRAGEKQFRAHRFSWLLNRGSIPEGQFVLHQCDNPKCVNPGHLFLGTHRDNMRDKVSKGRQAKGDRNGARTKPELHPRGATHGMSVLTEEQVRSIRLERSEGVSPFFLAEKYGVTHYAIWCAVTRRTWAHVV